MITSHIQTGRGVQSSKVQSPGPPFFERYQLNELRGVRFGALHGDLLAAMVDLSPTYFCIYCTFVMVLAVCCLLC